MNSKNFLAALALVLALALVSLHPSAKTLLVTMGQGGFTLQTK